jgi:hypothetical protein
MHNKKLPLTDVKTRALKPKEKNYKASDEKGQEVQHIQSFRVSAPC